MTRFGLHMDEATKKQVAVALAREGFETWQDLVGAPQSALGAAPAQAKEWGTRLIAAANARSRRPAVQFEARCNHKRPKYGNEEAGKASAAQALCTIAARSTGIPLLQGLPRGVGTTMTPAQANVALREQVARGMDPRAFTQAMRVEVV